MPRTKDLTLAERDRRIMQYVADGRPYSWIAEQENISKGRVGQIVLAHYDDIPPDGTRAWMRTILERCAQEMITDALGPGKRLITAKGPAYELDEYGEPDFTKPLFDTLARREVVDTIVKIFDRLSKNYGLDPWRVTDSEANPELDQYIQWAQQVALDSKKNQDRIAELEAKLAQYERPAIDVQEAEIVEDQALPEDPDNRDDAAPLADAA